MTHCSGKSTRSEISTHDRYIFESDFADEETDITLQNRLNAERAANHQKKLANAATARDEKGKPPAEDVSPPRYLLIKAIFYALGIVVSGNLAAIFISSIFNNWNTFTRGWPMELFLVSASLFFIMALCKSMWIFVPAGIIFTNGLIMAYCSLTGNWHHWAFLWVLEPWPIAAVLVTTNRLGKQPHNARLISRLLGWSLCVTSLTAAIITSSSAMAIGVLIRIFSS